MHGCGWDSGAQPESAAAHCHWLQASPRVTRSAPMAWALRARAPVRPWQPGLTASRYALGAEGGGAARPGAYLCPRVTAHIVSWGECGCRRRRVLPAAREARCKACFELLPRARREGGVAHREDLAATASATLERSAGTVAHGKRAARERRRRRSKVSRRRRAGHAPPARRGRRVRVPRAFKRPAKTLWWWWWWCAHTNSELPQAGFP